MTAVVELLQAIAERRFDALYRLLNFRRILPSLFSKSLCFAGVIGLPENAVFQFLFGKLNWLALDFKGDNWLIIGIYFGLFILLVV